MRAKVKFPKLRKGSKMHWQGVDDTGLSRWHHFPAQDVTVLHIEKSYAIIRGGVRDRMILVSCYMTGFKNPKWREKLIWESELSEMPK